MTSKRHSVGVQKTGVGVLVPDEVVAEHFSVALDQVGAEGSLTEQRNAGIGPDDTPVLLPERGQINGDIPCVMSLSIGQIAQHHINRAVGDGLHHFEAVAVIQRINWPLLL